MPMKDFALPLLAALAVLAIHPNSVSGQGGVYVYASAVFVSTPVPGYHIDEFSVVSSVGIRSLDAQVVINPMNQIQPDGNLTVFPVLLNSADLNKDSHFVFDTSSASILSQYEDTTQIRASVVFNANYPTSFELAQIVAKEGHAPYEAYVSGTLVDGSAFHTGIMFVPEPSVAVLGLCGAIVWVVFRWGLMAKPHGDR
jgi:hypothetical protein